MKHNDIEHSLQVAIIQYLRFEKVFVIAIPNGGRRDVTTGARLKKEGVVAGAPDLVLILNNGEVVWVELKTPKGSQQKTQKWFEEELLKRGHKYFIWRSLDDAKAFVQERQLSSRTSFNGCCRPPATVESA